MLFGVTGLYSFNALTDSQLLNDVDCEKVNEDLIPSNEDVPRWLSRLECLKANGGPESEIQKLEDEIDEIAGNSVPSDPIEVIGNDGVEDVGESVDVYGLGAYGYGDPCDDNTTWNSRHTGKIYCIPFVY